jgi:hypothetical protein
MSITPRDLSHASIGRGWNRDVFEHSEEHGFCLHGEPWLAANSTNSMSDPASETLPFAEYLKKNRGQTINAMNSL